jgi:hypothetical protein
MRLELVGEPIQVPTKEIPISVVVDKEADAQD